MIRPVSSRVSLSAAPWSVSPGWTEPPGTAHIPRLGSWARLISKTLPSLITAAAAATLGKVVSGKLFFFIPATPGPESPEDPLSSHENSRFFGLEEAGLFGAQQAGPDQVRVGRA